MGQTSSSTMISLSPQTYKCRMTHRIVQVVLLRRLLFVSLDDAELCGVLRVLHDVPVEGLR